MLTLVQLTHCARKVFRLLQSFGNGGRLMMLHRKYSAFLLAHEKYHEWGALGIGICNSLFKYFESTFSPASTDVGVGVGHPSNTTGT
jgi:hypothetical protein